MPETAGCVAVSGTFAAEPLGSCRWHRDKSRDPNYAEVPEDLQVKTPGRSVDGVKQLLAVFFLVQDAVGAEAAQSLLQNAVGESAERVG